MDMSQPWQVQDGFQDVGQDEDWDAFHTGNADLVALTNLQATLPCHSWCFLPLAAQARWVNQGLGGWELSTNSRRLRRDKKGSMMV